MSVKGAPAIKWMEDLMSNLDALKALVPNSQVSSETDRNCPLHKVYVQYSLILKHCWAFFILFIYLNSWNCKVFFSLSSVSFCYLVKVSRNHKLDTWSEPSWVLPEWMKKQWALSQKYMLALWLGRSLFIQLSNCGQYSHVFPQEPLLWVQWDCLISKVTFPRQP